jgi:carboxymethylenebutenolidase
MPAEAIEKLEAALASWGGRYESETYEGAFHSWTATGSPVYNHPQAERAYSKLLDILRSSLG